MDIVAKNPQDWEVPVRVRDGAIESFHAHADKVDFEADENALVECFVWQASLKYAGYDRSKNGTYYALFRDEAGIIVKFPPRAQDEIFSAVADGRIKVRGGRYEGLFSFKNYGGWISPHPLTIEDQVRLSL